MIKVINEVKVTSEHKAGHDVSLDEKIHVINHPDDDTMILLVLGEKSYKIVAKDLQAAVANATNCSRH